MKTLLFIILLIFPATNASAQTVPEARAVYLRGAIDGVMALNITTQLEYLDHTDPGKEITLFITSPGGEVMAGLQIYDTMEHLSSPVKTVCVGHCMSMAAILLAGGHTRAAYANATILVHSISMSLSGHLWEIENELKEGYRLQGLIDTILVQRTGKTQEQVTQMESYDHYMSPQEALKNGLIDEVQTPALAAKPAVHQQPVRRLNQ